MFLNFKEWLFKEGFSIDYTKLPRNLHIGSDEFDMRKIPVKRKKSKSVSKQHTASTTKKSNSTTRKKTIDEFHKTEGLFSFSPEDQPDHFIKAKNFLKELVIPGKEKLQSFKSKILYGMEFDMNEEKIKKYVTTRLDELLKKQNDLVNEKVTVELDVDHENVMKKIHSLVGNENSIINKVVDWDENNWDKEGVFSKPKNLTFNRVKKIWDQDKNLRKKYGHSYPQFAADRLKEIKKELTNIKVILSSLGFAKTNFGKLRGAKLKKARDDEKKLTRARPDMFHNIIQQSFLKKIKHPKIETDLVLSDRFVYVSVNNYLEHYINFRMNKPDIILYPQSSSNLVKKIAESLGHEIGCEAVLAFNKKQTPTIDTTSFIQKRGFDKGLTDPLFPKDLGFKFASDSYNDFKNYFISRKGSLITLDINYNDLIMNDIRVKKENLKDFLNKSASSLGIEIDKVIIRGTPEQKISLENLDKRNKIKLLELDKVEWQPPETRKFLPTASDIGRSAIQNLRTQIDQSKNQFKNIRTNQIFVNYLILDPWVISKVKGRHVLVIDDNARTGASLQIMNKLLWNQSSPKTVNFYVPLYANFSYPRL